MKNSSVVSNVNQDDFINITNLYFQEIHNGNLLTADEERDLFLRVRNGDLNARNLIIEKNLGLVTSIAKKYLGSVSRMQYLDLIEEGNIGLLEAIERYDLDKGCRFSTYATWWINKFIKMAIPEQDYSIPVSVYNLKKINLYKKTANDLKDKLGRRSEINEIAKEMNISVNFANSLNSLQSGAFSLNEMIDDVEYEVLFSNGDNVEDDFVLKELNSSVYKFLQNANLSETEYKVISLRCGMEDGIPLTFDEIGSRCGMTRQGAKSVFAKAIFKLRSSDDILKFVEYLDNPKEAVERLKWFREQYKGFRSKEKTYLDRELSDSIFGDSTSRRIGSR